MFFVALLSTVAAPAATIVVNGIVDANPPVTADGICSLREAMNAANTGTMWGDCAYSGGPPNMISFSGLIGKGPFTIRAVAPFPPITAPLTINGLTQAGAVANTAAVGYDGDITVQIDGTDAGESAVAFTIAPGGGGTVIRGLSIGHFQGGGIVVHSDGNTIAGNAIGVTINKADSVVTTSAVNVGNRNSFPAAIKIAPLAEGSASDNTIGGTTAADRNIISAVEGSGVLITADCLSGVTVDGNAVLGNYLGVDALGNPQIGVAISQAAIDIDTATHCRIGSAVGTSPESGCQGGCNVIGANSSGVRILSPSSATIEGNYIGVTADGNRTIGSTDSDGAGIVIGAQARGTTNVTIGGAGAAQRNLISGWAGVGVENNASAPETVTVEGNYIGTDKTGLNPLPNALGGIHTTNTIIIGGASPGMGNVISGNGSVADAGEGISIDGSGGNAVSHCVIQGNKIGVGPDGVTPVPNRKYGVLVINGNDNIIGAATAGGAGGNIIVDNEVEAQHGSGVAIKSGNDNRVLTNSIAGNVGVSNCCGTPDTNAIDLQGDGPTLNDDCDLDYDGANHLQNYPVLSKALDTGSLITISGTLNSTASTHFDLEFYANSPLDPREAANYLGTTSVTTDSRCHASFSASFGVPVSPLSYLTATATDPAGNTSEVSTPLLLTLAVRFDYDGDGKADVLWRNVATGDNAQWFMGGATLERGSAIPPIADRNFKIVGVGDFQGDGKADILWRNSATGENILWLMNGSTVAVSATLTALPDTNWQVAGIGDLQGDGKADILWRNTVTGDNAVWLMNGTSVALSASLPSVPDPSWKIVAVGDFQGDGKADLFWRNSASGSNAIWLMNGATVAVSARMPSVSDTNWQVVGVGDFQGDDKADLLWRNSATGSNAVWLINGLNYVPATLPTVPDTNFHVAMVGDFQGDGKVDILWRNVATGDNAEWLMNGSAVALSAVLPAVDPNWQVVP